MTPSDKKSTYKYEVYHKLIQKILNMKNRKNPLETNKSDKSYRIRDWGLGLGLPDVRFWGPQKITF